MDVNAIPSTHNSHQTEVDRLLKKHLDQKQVDINNEIEAEVKLKQQQSGSILDVLG